MLKIAIIDITSRNSPQYNPALCTALGKIDNCEVTLLSTSLKERNDNFSFKSLIRLVPSSKAGSESKLKRILRAVETFFNYFYIVIYVLVKRPNIIHFQWLPFLEYCGLEIAILRIARLIAPKTRYFWTVHNIYPHNSTIIKQKEYRNRVKKIDKLIDGYIVHLYSSKDELTNEFDLDQSKIHVAYHGIYQLDRIIDVDNTKNRKRRRIIMTGLLSLYKGPDILMEAIKLMPDNYIDRLEAVFVGKTPPEIFSKYEPLFKALNITWVNRFVEDSELSSAIDNSDLIVFPYRKISQSGVLLLSLTYNKPIIASDLPSFRETLQGYPEDGFFESENVESLKNTLMNYIDNKLDLDKMVNVIGDLNKIYSWEESAKNTLKAYYSVINH